MKRRLSAIVLALGLSLSVFSMGVYAAETETETVTEQVTEVVTEAAADEATAEEAEETAETETEMSSEEQTKLAVTTYLQLFESFTDEQLSMLADGSYEDAMDQFTAEQQMYIFYYYADSVNWETTAANYKIVKKDLGALVEVASITQTQDKESYTITADAKYEKTGDKAPVEVEVIIDAATSVMKIDWNIDYPMSMLMQQAGLNTIMGIAIVFLALLFLSFLIGKLHIIPDTIEKMAKKNAPVEAPKAAPAPAAAAPVAEEEEYVDDLELVAVITAAIAASENTSSDGFVVRSIKKANKRNWQRA